jgi:hypothetical protein
MELDEDGPVNLNWRSGGALLKCHRPEPSRVPATGPGCGGLMVMARPKSVCLLVVQTAAVANGVVR